MTDEMDQPATKRELHATRDDLRGEVGAVKRELHEVRDELKRDIGAVKRELHATRDDLRGEVGAVKRELHEVRDELKRDIAERPTYSQMLALFEDFEGRMRVMFDPYRDLPPRTARLEAVVFGPRDSTPSAPRTRTRTRTPVKRRKRAA